MLLLIGIYFQNQGSLNDRDSITYTYLSNAIQGSIGYGAVGYYGNMIDLSDLEPGDIILVVIQCAYGRFSHAGLYIGDGQVIEGYVDLGITQQSVEHFGATAKSVCYESKPHPSKNKQQWIMPRVTWGTVLSGSL